MVDVLSLVEFALVQLPCNLLIQRGWSRVVGLLDTELGFDQCIEHEAEFLVGQVHTVACDFQKYSMKKPPVKGARDQML